MLCFGVFSQFQFEFSSSSASSYPLSFHSYTKPSSRIPFPLITIQNLSRSFFILNHRLVSLCAPRYTFLCPNDTGISRLALLSFLPLFSPRLWPRPRRTPPGI